MSLKMLLLVVCCSSFVANVGWSITPEEMKQAQAKKKLECPPAQKAYKAAQAAALQSFTPGTPEYKAAYSNFTKANIKKLQNSCNIQVIINNMKNKP